MKKHWLILLFLFISHIGNSQCIVSSLVINTGYNPITATAIVPGTNGSTPIPDPKWQLTYVTPGVAAAIAATPIAGLIEVVPGNSADVVPHLAGWAANPATQHGAWISCVNSNQYTGNGDTATHYKMILGRPFRTCGNDSIKLDIYVACDDYLSSASIDGISLPFSESLPPLPSYYSTYTHFTKTIFLTSGMHTLNFAVDNYNAPPAGPNATGFDLYGTVSSATGLSTLIAENGSSCPAYTTTASHDTAVCSNVMALTAHPGYSYYHWSTGDTTRTTSISGAGTYWVQSVNGCNESVDTFHVSIVPLLQVSLGHDTAFCAGNSVTLSFYAPPYYNYAWSTGSSASSITVASSGLYWLIIYDSVCTSRDSVVVTVNPIPVVNLGNDTSFCRGNTLTLHSSGSYSDPFYSWNTGDNTPSIHVSSSGAYILTVSDLDCISSDTINVTVKALPVIELGNDTTLCNGTSLTLSVAPAAGTQYLWNTGSTASSITVAQAGTYGVIAVENGCFSSDSIKITTSNTPPVNLGPDTVICQGLIYPLSIDTANASYTWSVEKTGPELDVNASGTYWVALSNICGVATDTIRVDYVFCNMWVPNAFTPNNDGKNDFFRVVGSLSSYSDYSLSVFDRWGQALFITKDITKGWDGTLNGTPQEIGVYYYYITYTLNGAKGSMKGDLQLIR